jgi:hypothetical protein
MALCALTALVVILIKCRVPQSRRMIWLPMLPFALSLTYALLYVFKIVKNVRFLHMIAGDMTLTFCLLFTAVLESCIQCGLIQTNTGYDDLLRHSSIQMQITDKSGRVRMASENTGLAIGPCDSGVRVSSALIKNGRVVWREDVSALLEIQAELERLKLDLKGEAEVLHETYQTERRIQRLKEQNRLYDAMNRQTAKQIDLLGELLEKYKTAQGAEKRKLLAELAVVGVYLKRRNNLIFHGEQGADVPARELELCLDESAETLKLAGVDCAYYINIGETAPISAAMAIYDFFEAAIEEGFDVLRSLLLRAYQKDAGFEAVIDINDGSDSRSLAIPKGGEAV